MRTVLISRIAGIALAAALLVALCPVAIGQASFDDPTWYGADAEGNAQIHLYFAWSSTCPHCAAARPFVDELDDEYPWLVVHSLETAKPADVEQIIALAESLGETAQYVPMFLFCEHMETGFADEATSGAELRRDLVACRDAVQAAIAGEEPEPVVDDDDESISLPLLGTIDPTTVSLPLFTVVIAALDAFNPCAFFVLLFLLSLLVHARSRARMAMIGGTFVLISGLVYLAFMAAWLNMFLLVGTLPVITLVAGLVALVVAAISIKDFFWFQKGVSLSIPERAKPGLFRRMRGLTTSSSFPAMMVGTVTLAFAANAYELLCTAGFPMVFTRVLTLKELPTATYYLYLALYNIVYILPLLLIVGVFVWTLGSRKMSEQAGRTLKLLSGLMMLGLGLVLVLAHELLDNLFTAPLILLAALAVTGLIVFIDRARTHGGGQVFGASTARAKAKSGRRP